jgi:hypothetical protein
MVVLFSWTSPAVLPTGYFSERLAAGQRFLFTSIWGPGVVLTMTDYSLPLWLLVTRRCLMVVVGHLSLNLSVFHVSLLFLRWGSWVWSQPVLHNVILSKLRKREPERAVLHYPWLLIGSLDKDNYIWFCSLCQFSK